MKTITLSNTHTSHILDILAKQKTYYRSGVTHPLEVRRANLKALHQAITQFEPKLVEAVGKDLNKNSFEAYTTEIGLVYKEIRHAIKNLPRWMKPKKYTTDLHNLPGASRMYPEPYGVSLIIAPWNYPIQLMLSPLVGALAGGNTAVLKPSELAPATAGVMQEMIDQWFEPEAVAMVQGDAEVSTFLLEQQWDKIFFTGSVPVGKIVMEKAAKHLTPLTLELGGKSPVIVDDTADLDYTARKIVWGKFLNCGQTCVAPDYVLVVGRERADRFVELLEKYLGEFYGESPMESPHYTKIINDRHFMRLSGLLEGTQPVIGGQKNQEQCRIAPTVFYPVDLDHPVMADEIFGPLLPILPVDSLDRAFDIVLDKPKPLAAYLFTTSRRNEKRFIREIPAGGGCINNVVMHVASSSLPFGGVGPSGMGEYHGRASFDAFTHWKGMLKQSRIMEMKMAYPGKAPSLKVIRKILS